MMRRTPLLLVLAVLTAACQNAMSLEEAKKVTTSFRDTSLVPPRTIADVTSILSRHKGDTGAWVSNAAGKKKKADQRPPAGLDQDPRAFVKFYFDRGIAAGEIGRVRQEIDDLRKAAELILRASVVDFGDMWSPWRLIEAEEFGGSLSTSIDLTRRAIIRVPQNDRGWHTTFQTHLVKLYAAMGDLRAAEEALTELDQVIRESLRWTGSALSVENQAWFRYAPLFAQACISEAKGRFPEAEDLLREAVAALKSAPGHAQYTRVDLTQAKLAQVLARQGRLLEAEQEARAALMAALSKRGYYNVHTANVLRSLTRVVLEQGRFAEAETLGRVEIDILERTGSSSDSVLLALARDDLAMALAAQGRWSDALAQYLIIEAGLAQQPEILDKFFGANVTWALSLLRNQRADEALRRLTVARDRSERTLGRVHRLTAEVRGLRAIALGAVGQREAAAAEYEGAVRLALEKALAVDDEVSTRPMQDLRLKLILTSYATLLVASRGSTAGGRAEGEAVSEAFRLADVARGGSVQRAIDAGAARSAAKSAALAELTRKEQDAKKQINALQGTLVNALSVPPNQQNVAVINSLRGQVDLLTRARQTLALEVEREFPAYAQLTNPKPVTLEQTRASLKPDEALISTLVTEDRTFVWAVPHTGPVAFRSVPLGAAELEKAVAALRTALDPGVNTVGEIPPFDVGGAHYLYRELLDPVKSGWEHARTLLIVAHGPLAQLPFGLLVTEAVALSPEPPPLFSGYRRVPWLIRSHAVAVLPSVNSLLTLRRVPPADAGRRPFLGFGDPFFSEAQARRAALRGEVPAPAAPAPGMMLRDPTFTLRSTPKLDGMDSSQLAMLPPLPDTAEEIRSIARTLGADLTRDVFLGERANEQSIRTANLSDYRVIAFATHGLRPGDLDGLTQPALALTAPGVAHVEGDGLLTVEKILSLRLNADWVVLSACNTATGNGAGSEAISGLGRAFFYAGARALLVSNWPVETTSARILTTDLFRRQRQDPTLERAHALQQTLNGLIDSGEFVDPSTGKVAFSYAHPIFWAPFTLVGDGGGTQP